MNLILRIMIPFIALMLTSCSDKGVAMIKMLSGKIQNGVAVEQVKQ